MLTLRLTPYAEKLIKREQTAFMKTRNIMTGIMALHEVLHKTKRNKKVGVVLKLDFEKAYDKVDWNFLFDCLKCRGFDDKWINWIKSVVMGGTLSVKINNQLGPYFMSHKGVRQGDPLSPILFNFAADCLTRMVHNAQNSGLITGLAANLIPKGVAILQYADDTIICIEDDIEKARNVKLLLYIYEAMSGLKINFLKSEIVMVNGDNNIAQQYADIFNCQVGLFPIRYLGVPVSPSRLHAIDWTPLHDKNGKKLDIWKGGSLSIAGRTTLINSSMSNSFIYHMSMYLLPQTTTEKLDRQRRTFFWQGGGQKRKYHLVRWEKICKSKKKGGLGIKDIRKMNISLLCKWWWKLDTEQGLWQDLVKAKYIKNGLINTVQTKFNDSPVWKDLMKIRHFYIRGRKVKANNGEKTLLWTDSWMEETPLCLKLSTLFELCKEKSISVADCVKKGGQVEFRRWLPEVLYGQWNNMKMSIMSRQFAESPDEVYWKWNKSGKFSVKSTYDYLTQGDEGDPHTKIWKAKIPYKIKNFLWLLENDATLTKENMVKRKWVGDPSCRFCDSVETTEHLFFQCPTAKVVWSIVAICLGANNIPMNIQQFWNWADHYLPNHKHTHGFGVAAICWATWKARNKACFERKLIKHPAEILLHACAFLNFWTGLFKQDVQEQLAKGVKVLLSTACRILASQQASPPQLLLPPEDDETRSGEN